MGRRDGTLEACDAPADQAGSATLSVTGKRLGGAVTEEIVEPALVPRWAILLTFEKLMNWDTPHGSTDSVRRPLVGPV
jgi:hypothetical protein